MSLNKEKNPPNAERIILGVDPGTSVMGYGLIRIKKTSPEMLAMGIIDLRKYSDYYQKMNHIFHRCCSLMEEFKPDELAVEAPFYGKNVQSMLKLGRAQGIAIAAALRYHIPIYEYAPLRIKQAITGRGSASKEQVAHMAFRYLKIPMENMPSDLDATDGLAAALCHYFQSNNPTSGRKYTGWKDFINKHPNKVKK